MGKRRKKKEGLTELELFVKRARERGLTYGQAQVKETCELLRIEKLKAELSEKRRKEKEVEASFFDASNGV